MTWCNTCKKPQKSWYETCKGACDSDCRNRCEKCNNLFNAMVVSPDQTSIATTEAQRAQLAREAASWTRENGVVMEPRIEIIKYPDGSTVARQSVVARPDIWNNWK